MMLKLISATPSPYARKVRITLAEKAIPFELVTEVPWNSTTATPLYNPLEKLPVLVLPDGSGVYESRFILEWIEAKHPEPPMLPQDTDARLFARQVVVVPDGVCDALVLLFWERHRASEKQSAGWEARQRRKVDGGMAALAGWAGTSVFMVKGQFGLADVAAGTPGCPPTAMPSNAGLPSRAACPCRRPSVTRLSDPCAIGRPTCAGVTPHERHRGCPADTTLKG